MYERMPSKLRVAQEARDSPSPSRMQCRHADLADVVYVLTKSCFKGYLSCTHRLIHPLMPTAQTRERAEEIARDSTRPIRALNRGLEVLTELNRLERAAINTLAPPWGCRAPPPIAFWKRCASPAMSIATRTMTATGRPSWCAPCRTASTMRHWWRISPSRCSRLWALRSFGRWRLPRRRARR